MNSRQTSIILLHNSSITIYLSRSWKFPPLAFRQKFALFRTLVVARVNVLASLDAAMVSTLSIKLSVFFQKITANLFLCSTPEMKVQGIKVLQWAVELKWSQGRLLWFDI